MPVIGLAWTVVGDDHLSSEVDPVVPAYMVQSSVTGPEHGILVVRGDIERGLTYTVRRDDGLTVGEDEIAALSDEDTEATATITEFLSRPTGDAVAAIADLGIEWVIQTSPADGDVASSLDATSGLLQASTDPGSRAWQVSRPLSSDAIDGPGSVPRTLLYVGQGLLLLLVLVLCLPTVRPRREA